MVWAPPNNGPTPTIDKKAGKVITFTDKFGKVHNVLDTCESCKRGTLQLFEYYDRCYGREPRQLCDECYDWVVHRITCPWHGDVD